jgi:RNA polymerase sigma-70 factor, ECF subfamily
VSQDADKVLIERFVSNQDMLYGYIVSILPNWADADEVFQETSLILWERRGSYDPERSFIAWSYGIARNVAHNFIRKNLSSGRTLNSGLFDEVEEARLRLGDVMQRQADALRHCLERLTDKQRTFLMNCYSTNSPKVQLAGQLGLSENAVYLKLSRLRKTLLGCIRRTLRREEGV